MKKILLILFIFMINKSYSRILYSTGNGNWKTNTTWSLSNGGTSCLCEPTNNDTINILLADTVTVENNINQNSWYIFVNVYGVLKFENGKITVKENSIFNIHSNGLIFSTDSCNCDQITIGTKSWKGKENGNITGPSCLPDSLCDVALLINKQEVPKLVKEEIFEKIEIYNSNRVLNIEIISKKEDYIYIEVHTVDGKRLFFDMINIHIGENLIEYEFYRYKKDIYIITVDNIKKKIIL